MGRPLTNEDRQLKRCAMRERFDVQSDGESIEPDNPEAMKALRFIVALEEVNSKRRG